MSLGRRKVPLEDEARWVFNRMAEVYDARPAYPSALVERIASLVPKGTVLVDIGAGIGHFAIPLASRGVPVIAVDPARKMLDRLRATAPTIETHHASAEAMPLGDDMAGAALIADAMHFVDAERAGREIGRVLAPRGALAIVTSELGATPFTRALVQRMEEAAPRRPRDTSAPIAQLASLAGVGLDIEERFVDVCSVDEAQLERFLRSISFVGPAMSPERFARFMSAVRAIDAPRELGRVLTLRAGRRLVS